MWELTAETVNDYLTSTHRLARGEAADVTLLTGGVSNVVLLVTPAHGPPFVLKQSRAQLRTKADWFSRIERIFREAEAQQALAQMLPAGTVPLALFEDRENFLYAMAAVRRDHDVWKRQLLSRHIDPQVFERAGLLLADIHGQTAGKPELLSDSDDTSVFFELRIDPFYRRIAEVHPSIRTACDDLIGEMQKHRLSFTHADFSPKNLLVHPDGVTLVDHETVHYGDPAFDLGFFFSHLWLKAVALTDVRSHMIAGIQRAWQAYQSRLPSTRIIELKALSRRAVRHFAACLLSRIDGKSPVDYLTEAAHQEFVRQLSLRWLNSPPADFNAAFQEFSRELSPSEIFDHDLDRSL